MMVQWCTFEWLGSYGDVQRCAVVLIYIQVICASIGALGALYGSISVANLAVALFALVAIESGSQTLSRTYAVLLLCMLLLDIAWFILFSHDIWKVLKDPAAGTGIKVSIKAVFSTEIIGFVIRFLSAFLWLQMYRLGASPEALANSYQAVDFGGIGTVGFVTPLSSPAPSRQVSVKDEEVVGGSIYYPAYYSSLFPAGRLDETIEIEEGLNLNGDIEAAAKSSSSTVRSLFS